MSDVKDKIIDIIAKKSPVARENISLESRMDDIDVESLDFVEIIFELEEHFDISLPYNANEASDLQTVGDVVVAVEKLVGQNSSG